MEGLFLILIPFLTWLCYNLMIKITQNQLFVIISLLVSVPYIRFYFMAAALGGHSIHMLYGKLVCSHL